MIANFGIQIFVLSLCLQSSLLIQGQDAQRNFNNNMTLLKQYSPIYDYVRYCLYCLAVLYASSLFILITSSCLVPFVTSLGVILNTFFAHFPALIVDQNNQHAMVGVLKGVCVLGGLLYLIGSSFQRAIKVKAQ